MVLMVVVVVVVDTILFYGGGGMAVSGWVYIDRVKDEVMVEMVVTMLV
jgi:hypothetical protein